MSVPANLQPVLWSYNVSKLDIKRNEHLIITQVLNYGFPEDLEWLLKTYNLSQITSAVSSPDRGIWFRDKLQHWLTKLNLEIDPMYFDMAIREIDPKKVSPKLYQEFYKRKGVSIAV